MSQFSNCAAPCFLAEKVLVLVLRWKRINMCGQSIYLCGVILFFLQTGRDRGSIWCPLSQMQIRQKLKIGSNKICLIMCPSKGYTNIKLRAHANFRKSFQDGEAGQDQVFYKLGDIQPFINWDARAKSSSLNCLIDQELLVITYLLFADTCPRKSLVESWF